MRSQSLAPVLVGAAVVCLLLAVYYLVPGLYHPFTFSGTPTSSHLTHAIAFAALAAVAFLGSRFARNAAQ